MSSRCQHGTTLLQDIVLHDNIVFANDFKRLCLLARIPPCLFAKRKTLARLVHKQSDVSTLEHFEILVLLVT